MKPKPNAPKELKKSPFLSRPAAIPSLFLKIKPLNSNDSNASFFGKSIL
jgi:hypothetical protein